MTKPSIEKTLQQAYGRMEALDYGEAAKLFDKAHKATPGNAAVVMGMAILHNRTGQAHKALPMLQGLWKTLQTHPDKVSKPLQAEVMAQVGRAFELMGQHDPALGAYLMANRLHPSEASRQLIANQQQLHALENNGNPYAQVQLHALQHARAGRLAEAAKAFRAALVLNSESDQALHGLGDVLRRQGDLAGAMKCLQQAVVMQPGMADYHNTLGMVFLDLNEPEKALKALQRSLKLNPKNPLALCNSGVALRRLQRLDDAVKAYKAAIKLAPQMAEAHNNLGNVYLEMKDKSKAADCYQQALAIKPDYTDAKRNLEDLLNSKKSTPQKRVVAKAVSNKTVRKTPSKLASSAPAKAARKKA